MGDCSFTQLDLNIHRSCGLTALSGSASEYTHCVVVVSDWMGDCSFTQLDLNIHWGVTNGENLNISIWISTGCDSCCHTNSCFCWGLNLQPFDHKPGALITSPATELSPFPSAVNETRRKLVVDRNSPKECSKWMCGNHWTRWTPFV